VRPAVVVLLGFMGLFFVLPGTVLGISRDQALPSWQGDVRESLVDYVFDVSSKAHKDFIPPRDRIAVFDMDGTLMSEKPNYFVFDVAIHYLKEYAPEISSKGTRYKALCDAAKAHDFKYLRKHIRETFVLPFEGKTYETYKAYCLKVFETAINPVKKRPLKDLVYRPMVELIDLLHERGFRVFVVSGSLQFSIMAISEKYFHVESNRCIGSMVEAVAEKRGSKIVFTRGGVKPPINLKEGKAIRIKMRTGKVPVLALGNSLGDTWMLSFPATSSYRHLSLVVDHDDPREFVYRKPSLLEMAKERNWGIVSIKTHFKTIYSAYP
jgi:phosphoserine phosphatase